MGSRKRVKRPKKPKYVIVDYDRYGTARIYYRVPGVRKLRLRGPLFSEEFWSDYAAATTGKLKPREKSTKGELPAAGTFDRMCVEYYQSADYRALSPDTRYRRRLTIEPIREKCAALPVRKMQPKHIRAMRDRRADKPHVANELIKVLRQLFQFGVEYGFVERNPAREVPTIKGKRGGYHTWSPDEIAQYCEYWPVGTQERLALDLMLFTGMRRGDAIRIGPQHLKGGRLIFAPEKTRGSTGKRLSIPVHPALSASIAATKTGDMTLLTTKHGKPWGAHGKPEGQRTKHRAASFGNRFKSWCKAAGLPHCSAHGLRKAAAVMLVEAGCSSAEATAITGHDSLQVFEGYIRERDRKRLADAGMERLIKASKSGEGVPPDFGMIEDGTKTGDNLLIGKGPVWALAPRTGLEPVTR